MGINKIKKALAQRAYLQDMTCSNYYCYVNCYNCVNIFALKFPALLKCHLLQCLCSFL